MGSIPIIPMFFMIFFKLIFSKFNYKRYYSTKACVQSFRKKLYPLSQTALPCNALNNYASFTLIESIVRCKTEIFMHCVLPRFINMYFPKTKNNSPLMFNYLPVYKFFFVFINPSQLSFFSKKKKRQYIFKRQACYQTL